MKRISQKSARKKQTSHSNTPSLFFTCEHAGNEIPARYRTLFRKSQGVLKTHRGWDPGAFEIAKDLKNLSKAPFYFTKLSRLVVDMNRSPESPTALSKWTKSLSEKDQKKIFSDYYTPYRSLISSKVDAELKSNRRLIHLGIHSFSPYLDSSRRGCHIGILFDPKSRFESDFSKALEETLKLVFPRLGIRLNFPYRGDADGLTTDLRKRYRKQLGRNYAGIEIEFNQAFLRTLSKRKSTKEFARLFYFCVDSALNTL